MSEVTLEQMLSAREMRVARQQELLLQYKCPLICFTLNIAGPIKYSPLIERTFFAGISALEKSIPEEKINSFKTYICETGCEMIMSVRMDASILKNICVEVEETTPIGRLFDMDVIDKNGDKLSRDSERGCIVCGAHGRGCCARRIHSVSQLWDITQKIMTDYFKEQDKERFANLATQSLIAEARTTPKPGLVDMNNNGSHSDMNLDMFIRSAHSLKPYFSDCIAIGQNAGENFGDIFPGLRRAGLAAEKTMYKETHGVNTHKGAIYSMGVICGALGSLWSADSPVPSTDELFSRCGTIAKKAVEKDFTKIDKSTAGGRFFLEKGIKGIRGEVSSGFPSVRNISLPAFEKAISAGFSTNDAAVVALLHLVANVDDTNLYNRGGEEGSNFAKNIAKKLLSESPFPCVEKVAETDKCFIEKNLSPGGSADLLAVTYFLYWLNKREIIKTS